MVKIAIVEDENAASDQLVSYCGRYAKENAREISVMQYQSTEQLFAGEYTAYDMILMDIELPGLDGFSAVKKLRAANNDVAVIFVTNLAQYAVKGYEVEALDFIVKPVRYSSFEMKMRRILQAVDLKKGREVLLNVGGTVRVLTSSSIYYVEVMDHDLTYHTSQGDVTVRGKLSAVEQQLPKEVFFRCSTSYLINLQHVRQLTGDTVLVGDRELRVSRGKKKELMAALAACLGRGV